MLVLIKLIWDVWMSIDLITYWCSELRISVPGNFEHFRLGSVVQALGVTLSITWTFQIPTRTHFKLDSKIVVFSFLRVRIESGVGRIWNMVVRSWVFQGSLWIGIESLRIWSFDGFEDVVWPWSNRFLLFEVIWWDPIIFLGWFWGWCMCHPRSDWLDSDICIFMNLEIFVGPHRSIILYFR